MGEDVRFTQNVVKKGLRNVASHHIESFDYAMQKCLPRICQYMLPVEVVGGSLAASSNADAPAANASAGAPGSAASYPFQKYRMWFEQFELRKPTRPGAGGTQGLLLMGNDNEQSEMFPAECRMRSLTYQAPLYATLCRRIDDENPEKINICIGEIPVMVRSKNCNLSGLTEEQLIRKKEDMYEFGGYFIINGNERIVRMLIMNKRNYPVAFERGSFVNRGKFFTPYAVQMRCVRDDMFAQTITLHYLSDGNCTLKFIY